MQIIVDANSVCHRMKHTMGDLSFEERKVGILFGFLRQILSIAKRFDTNQFIFCWDSRSRKRTQICPAYKANRHKELTKEEEELNTISYAQFDTLRTEILPKLGFKNNFIAEGYEADDIIAKVVKDNGYNFVIVSTDNDLFQLFNPRISMMIDIKKPLYTEKTFRQEYDLLPDQWVMIKAIGGCSSDNVIGVKGVGIKTASKFLHGLLPRDTKTYQAIKDAHDQISLNKRLVTLPFEGTPSFTLLENQLSLDGFIDIASRYGFVSFLQKDNFKVWKRVIF